MATTSYDVIRIVCVSLSPFILTSPAELGLRGCLGTGDSAKVTETPPPKGRGFGIENEHLWALGVHAHKGS